MECADFFVEDLLDLSNVGDEMIMTGTFLDSVTGISTDSSSPAPVSDTCNSSGSGGNLSSFPDSQFSSDLCVPCDELEELEWLSNFVEESFSTEELHKYQFTPTQPSPVQYSTRQPNTNPLGNQPSNVPGKARSKRSRVVPCDWSTRLLMVPTSNTPPATSSSSNQNPTSSPLTGSKKSIKKRESGNNDNDSFNNGEVRRCLHCAAEKTPQWRTGPMGPKTLCNACGVRFKSGRLVPEYRPAASPTFMSAKHSNSHRKVIELRRQKDMQRQQQHFMDHHHHLHQSMMMGVPNGGDDYMIQHHLAPDYRHMI